jgi:hypothetical protein
MLTEHYLDPLAHSLQSVFHYGQEDSGDALWIRPLARWSGAALEPWIRQFDGYRPILWVCQFGSSHSAAIQNKMGVFAGLPALARNRIAAARFEEPSTGLEVASDVSWVYPDAHDQLAKVLARTTAPTQSLLAFLPASDKAGSEWSGVVQALGGAMLAMRLSTARQHYLNLVEQILTACVRSVFRLGGFPVVHWSDVDARPGIALIGNHSFLDRASTNLTNHSSPMTSEGFAKMLRRGIHLPVLT